MSYPTVGGGCYQHPIHWIREHQEDIAASIAELVAAELIKIVSFYPEAPPKPVRKVKK
jgi:hypothetical protein